MYAIIRHVIGQNRLICVRKPLCSSKNGQIERVLERRWSCNTISLTLWNLSSNDIYTINFLILKPSRLFDIDHAFRSREPSSWQPPILLKSAFTGMTVGHFWLTTILLEKPLFSLKTLNKIINMAFDKNKWYDSGHMLHMICMLSIDQIDHVVASWFPTEFKYHRSGC